jgi:hypothetical protein
MGMFGTSAKVDPSRFDPSQLSTRDKVMLFAAGLKDAGAALGGRDSDALLNTQSLLAGRQQQARKLDLLGQLSDMMGGQPQSTLDQVSAPQVGLTPPPAATSAAVPLSDPRWAKLALMAPQLGVDLSPLLKVQEMNKPEYVNGMRVNPYSPTAPAFIPTFDKGQAPDMDASGQVTGVHNLPGAVGAAADMAGAVAGAQEGQKAAYDLVDVPMSDGSTVKLPRAIAVPLLARNAGQFGVGGAPAPAGKSGPTGGPRFGVSQSPAEAEAAKIHASTRANAQESYASDTSAIDTAIDTVNKLIGDPDLKYRTGALSIVPAMPGTHGVAIDALKKQVAGQTFMDAYGQLRGGGQITEVEGTKAQQAKQRMDAAQTYEDYVAAAKDYRAALMRGKELLTRKAGGVPPAPTEPARRQTGQVYQTPRGPMKWTGTGWLPQ